MIHAAIDLPSLRPQGDELITEALRCWARARAAGLAAAPQLHRLLAVRGRPMLAPMLDSLMQLFQHRLGRPPVAGIVSMSEDETLLLELIARPDDIATPFDTALCSFRAMLREGW